MNQYKQKMRTLNDVFAEHARDVFRMATRSITEDAQRQMAGRSAAIDHRELFAAFNAKAKDVAQKATEAVGERNREMVQTFVRQFGEILGECQNILWSRGWMVDDKCPLVAIVKEAERGDGTRDDNALDDFMLQYFKETEEKHREFLLQSWPDRMDALSEAFSVASQGHYRSSILDLLTIAEYISRERLGVGCFSIKSKKGGKRILEVYERVTVGQPQVERILQVLDEYSPICCQESDVRDSSIVNRHNAIHGHSDTYGTEMNYFRCLSLLVFLTAYLPPLRTK